MITSASRGIDRRYLDDGSFVEIAIHDVPKEQRSSHGFRYRLVWVQVLEEGSYRRRVLFDNHHGKSDHYHLDESERPCDFTDIDQLLEDFAAAIRNLGGQI
jgi:hypothetical protein